METVYYTTRNFIRHQGNMVDLSEYRRRLAQIQGTCALETEPQPVQVLREEAAPRRARQGEDRGKRRPLADWLELTATVMTVALTAVILVQFLLV